MRCHWSPGRSTAIAAIKQARAQGLVVSLDPNYRARIGPDTATLHRLLRELCPLTTIMKPSLDDAVAIFGPGQAPAEYIERFQEYRCAAGAFDAGQRRRAGRRWQYP